MKDLSILIPARQEMFLARTIEDILANIEADTEIIVVLDGAWADPPVKEHERVTVVYLPEAVGQRAATNIACRLSKAKYVMKVDAHCAFDKGFDRKMIAEMHDDWTMVPTMRNLWAFDWKCYHCGKRTYQGPTPEKCVDCGRTDRLKRKMLWIGKERPQSNSFCFDSEPHFQYFNEYSKRPEGKGDITETMSLQGSCFMLTRKKYWELNISDESFGSWGSQGIEVACKTWLSGGKVMVNHKTWYAHMFRTQGGDFSFPYPQKESKVQAAKKYAKDLFFNDKWDKQIHPLSWLVEKFWPVPGWTQGDLDRLKEGKILTKGIIYYTDNQLDPRILQMVQDQLNSVQLPIVSASLQPINFGQNIHLPLERGVNTMFRQILAALEASTAEIIFMCEHDVLYHHSHFNFTPTKKGVFYFNTNVWKVDKTGRALKVADCRQVSGMCAYRQTLLDFYREKVKETKTVHYEPTKSGESWQSPYPNIDIRHDSNLTPSRWTKEKFRNQKNTEGWTETTVDKIAGWDNLSALVQDIK